MKLTDNKRWSRSFMASLALALLIGLPINAPADETMKANNDAYLEQIIGMLRSHVLSMHMILDHDDLKYADNIVRHAEALERTFGMIGPMEWHVAEAFDLMQKGNAAEKLSQEEFDDLAENSRRALNQIKRSAMRYLRDKKKPLVRESINGMIKSCGACHSKLPEGTVPGVWKGMKE